ncbi:MAG: hypothetical protein CK425_02035 [Parachlamydia sp.]|nr:MAG: hypothetical protein CK425_02035 [Parachlamydia sp.]
MEFKIDNQNRTWTESVVSTKLQTLSTVKKNQAWIKADLSTDKSRFIGRLFWTIAKHSKWMRQRFYHVNLEKSQNILNLLCPQIKATANQNLIELYQKAVANFNTIAPHHQASLLVVPPQNDEKKNSSSSPSKEKSAKQDQTKELIAIELTSKNYSVDEDSSANIQKALKDCAHASKISIKKWPIDKRGIQTLVEALAKSKDLQELTLSAIEDNCYDGMGDALVQILLTHPKLTSVNFSNFLGLSNHDSVKIAQALIRTPNIQLFNYRGNILDEAGSAAFADYLKTNPPLQCLLLEETFAVAPPIFKALTSNTNLQVLALCCPFDAKDLAELIKNNQALRSLYLTGLESLDDTGLKELAEALKTNNTLTYLDLEGHEVTREGILSLFDALKVNTSLTINLANCTNVYTLIDEAYNNGTYPREVLERCGIRLNL